MLFILLSYLPVPPTTKTILYWPPRFALYRDNDEFSKVFVREDVLQIVHFKLKRSQSLPCLHTGFSQRIGVANKFNTLANLI